MFHQIHCVVNGATSYVENRRASDDALRYGCREVRLRLDDDPIGLTESVPEIKEDTLD